jgi:hypothetical protein
MQVNSELISRAFCQMVVYVMCFDSSDPPVIQNQQIKYWLDFLQSTLVISPESQSKSSVVIVGTKSDNCKNLVPPDSIQSWRVMWSQLPIHNQQFSVSAHKNQGIHKFLNELERICNNIFDHHSLHIPQICKTLLEHFQSLPSEQFIVPISQIPDMPQFKTAIKYLHAIGQVILLKNDLICIKPHLIPKITAQFVSPKDVRDKLLVTHGVEILDKSHIGALLEIQEQNKEFIFLYFTHLFLFFLIFF